MCPFTVVCNTMLLSLVTAAIDYLAGPLFCVCPVCCVEESCPLVIVWHVDIYFNFSCFLFFSLFLSFYLRCIVPVKVRFGDKPLSYVLTGGMGYLPRPGLKDDMFRMEGMVTVT